MARGKKIPINYDKMREVDSYTHDGVSRTNNPPVGMAQYDTAEEKVKTYEYDPHISPSLQWAGKTEGISFDVPTSSIHIHESIKPHKIIKSVQNLDDDSQLSLWETPGERMKRRRESIEFYQHGVDWTNRIIAGDSLVIMNSMLEKEGMAGQVQMAYIDPPYGIKYGSNFQPFVNKRDVKDGKDEDLSQEPEMIKAFRDTWELGIHSYLTYLRNRLLLTRELLADSGSVFIQISDENLHFVRNICDEVFGIENFCSVITFKKKLMPFGAKVLEGMSDYIVWYAKSKSDVKYNKLYDSKSLADDSEFRFIDTKDGGYKRLSEDELESIKYTDDTDGIFKRLDLCSSGYSATSDFPIEFEGKIYRPTRSVSWKTNEKGIEILKQKNRLFSLGSLLYYKIYLNDYPVKLLTNLWSNTRGEVNKKYVVQTSTLPIRRCMLMTTHPGDLVLDITCGSGTTAYVAEQWGRRWITCDTSRVAITLAKQRLMTSTYDYYKLAYEEQGVSSGFIYKIVPHITLGSIAHNEPPSQEILYDQPEIDKTKVRITGPFTVEALPAPVVKPLNDVADFKDESAKQTDWRDELYTTGILGRGGNKIEFSRVELLQGTKFLQAESETKENEPRRAVICFGSETRPLDSRMVSLALDEVETLRPKPKLVIFAAFQFDPEAAKDIDETIFPGITLLKVQMNTDLMTADLKKKRSSNQSFWLIGQPDVDLIRVEKGKNKGKYKVRVNGFDYYDVKNGTVDSGNADRISMWMLDTNYDGLSIEPCQVFFPMGGKNDGWNKLAKSLKAEINQDLIEQYEGNESLPFMVNFNTQIAVKIVDDRGIESLKIIKVGDK